jgi:hypothetical protein
LLHIIRHLYMLGRNSGKGSCRQKLWLIPILHDELLFFSFTLKEMQAL